MGLFRKIKMKQNEVINLLDELRLTVCWLLLCLVLFICPKKHLEGEMTRKVIFNLAAQILRHRPNRNESEDPLKRKGE